MFLILFLIEILCSKPLTNLIYVAMNFFYFRPFLLLRGIGLYPNTMFEDLNDAQEPCEILGFDIVVLNLPW